MTFNAKHKRKTLKNYGDSHSSYTNFHFIKFNKNRENSMYILL